MLVADGTASAFVGAWTGATYFRKATIEVRYIVVSLMLLIGAGLIFGVLGTWTTTSLRSAARR